MKPVTINIKIGNNEDWDSVVKVIDTCIQTISDAKLSLHACAVVFSTISQLSDHFEGAWEADFLKRNTGISNG